MPQQEPDTIAKSLLNQLNELKYQLDKSEFVLLRIENQARDLLKADAVAGYVVLMALAALRYDLDNLEANFSKAHNLEPLNPQVWHAYAIALASVFDLERAFGAACKAGELEPLELAYLNTAIEYAFESGQFSQALKLIDEWDKRSPKRRCKHSKLIERVADIAETLDIKEDELKHFVSASAKLAQSHKYLPAQQGVNYLFMEDAESAWINCRIAILASVDDIVDIDIELSDMLAMGEFDIDLTSKVVVTFEASKEQEDAA